MDDRPIIQDLKRKRLVKRVSLGTLFWPKVDDIPGAVNAVNTAATWALLAAAVTGTIAIYAFFFNSIAGFDGTAFGDAILLTVVGWRIRRFSQGWAIVGLIYWISNMLYKLSTPQTGVSPIGIISILILFGFINGIRGIRAFEKLSKRPELEAKRA